MWAVLLPPGVNPIAVKWYHIISNLCIPSDFFHSGLKSCVCICLVSYTCHMFRPSQPPDLFTLIICGDKYTLWCYPLRNFFHPSATFPFLGPDGLLSIQDNSLMFLHTEPSDHLFNNNKSNGAFNYNQIVSGSITWLHTKTGSSWCPLSWETNRRFIWLQASRCKIEHDVWNCMKLKS
jgi:hypothetical protein